MLAAAAGGWRQTRGSFGRSLSVALRPAPRAASFNFFDYKAKKDLIIAQSMSYCAKLPLIFRVVYYDRTCWRLLLLPAGISLLTGGFAWRPEFPGLAWKRGGNLSQIFFL